MRNLQEEVKRSILLPKIVLHCKKKSGDIITFYDTAPRSYDPLFKTISMKEAGKLLPSF